VIDEQGIAHGMPGHSKCIVRDPSAWAPGQPLCNPQHLRPPQPRHAERPVFGGEALQGSWTAP
jgi:hypothetical protein